MPAKPAARRAAPKRRPDSPKRVGGKAGTAGKAEGDAPVRAFIAALPQWQRRIAQRFDDIVAKEVPKVRRAVKWSVPFYGIEGQGWFASFGAFAKHVKIGFFRGTDLNPPPPNGSGKGMRSLDLKETDEFDAALITAWVKQASRIPGWGA